MTGVRTPGHRENLKCLNVIREHDPFAVGRDRQEFLGGDLSHGVPSPGTQIRDIEDRSIVDRCNELKLGAYEST